MKFGAHVSISGGYTKALEKITKMGGNCLQIFSTSPRGWNFAKINKQQISQFLNLKSQLKIDPVYFHASYLVNLAYNNRIGQLSKQLLKHELKIASELGIRGSIIHLGSFKDKVDNKSTLQLFNGRDKVVTFSEKYKELIVNIKEVLNNTPKNTLFIIENAGNRKIGKDLAEISAIIDQVDDNRLRICLDTCHLYSAGYDLSTENKLNEFLEAFDSLVGLEKLEVIHANDSRDPFNSGRDRHENIGRGELNSETFKLLLNHPKTKHLPFIIETPGFNNQGPDKKNLGILKSFIN